MIGMVQFEIPAGISPIEAARQLVRRAREIRATVQGSFNGVPMIATCYSNAEDVAARFDWDVYEQMTSEQRCQAGL